MAEAPKRIWVHTRGWSERVVQNGDLAYVRADLYERAVQALQALMDGLHESFGYVPHLPEGDYLDTMPHLDEPAALANAVLAEAKEIAP